MANNIINKRTSVTVREVINEIPNSYGEIEPIEKALNCTRSAVKKILECNPEVRQELEDEKERCLDRIIVDAKMKAIRGDRFARDSVLKAEARDRGYGEKPEETQTENTPLLVMHYQNIHLTSEGANGAGTKEERLEKWSKAAQAYNNKQALSIKKMSVEDIARAALEKK